MLDVLLGHECIRCVADDVCPLVTEMSRQRLVHHLHLARLVEDVHRVSDIFDQGAIPLQVLFVPAFFGDVRDEPLQCDEVAVLEDAAAALPAPPNVTVTGSDTVG